MKFRSAEPPVNVDAVTYKKLTGWNEIACPLSELPGGHEGYYQPDAPLGGRYICYQCHLSVIGETLARICKRIGQGHALLFPELVDVTPRQAAKASEVVVRRLDDEEAIGELEGMGE